MEPRKLVLDVSDATSPLYVRQAVARFLGLPLDREFTWEFLGESIATRPHPELAGKITVVVLPRLAARHRDESFKLSKWLHELESQHPDISVHVVLHD